MSVTSTFYTVDWEALVAGYAREHGTEYIADAIERGEPWLTEIEIARDRKYHLSNWRSYTDFTEIFEELARDDGLGADEPKLRSFFAAVGCLQDARHGLHPLQELIEGEVEWVYGAFSTISVDRLLAQSLALSFEPYLARLDALIAPKQDCVFERGNQWRVLLRGWQKMLNDAHAAGRGLLILAG
jgi:hypothetical protein